MQGAASHPQQRRPASPYGFAPGNSTAKKALALIRCGPQWLQRDGGARRDVLGAAAIPWRKSAAPRCSGGSCNPTEKEAPAPMRRMPPQSRCEIGAASKGRGSKQSHCEKGPVPMRQGPPWLQGNSAAWIRRGPLLLQNHGGRAARRRPGNPTTKEAPALMWRGPRWLQSDGGDCTDAATAPVVPPQSQPPPFTSSDATGAPIPPKRHTTPP